MILFRYLTILICLLVSGSLGYGVFVAPNSFAAELFFLFAMIFAFAAFAIYKDK